MPFLHLFFPIFFLSHFLLLVESHSFIICTNAESKFSDPPYCSGFPRGFDKFDPNNDILFAFRPGRSNVACDPSVQPRSIPIMNSYSEEFPITIAKPGERLVIQWQANRHKNGTVEIFKENVKRFPQTEVELAMVGPDLNVDPPASTFEQQRNIVARFPFGDNNCDPQGDEKFGRCGAEFQVPSRPGVFTYRWKWRFNITYTSCFDILVTSDANSTNVTNADSRREEEAQRALRNQLSRDLNAVRRDGTQDFSNRDALRQNARAAKALEEFNRKANQTGNNTAVAPEDANDDGGSAKKDGKRFFSRRRGRRRNRNRGRLFKREIWDPTSTSKLYFNGSLNDTSIMRVYSTTGMNESSLAINISTEEPLERDAIAGQLNDAVDQCEP